MRIIECKNYDEMSRIAARFVASVVYLNPHACLGLPTGSTPVGMYKNLAGMQLDFSAVKTFNLDEYYPIKRDNDQSYYYFMFDNLFNHINIDPKNVHVPNGEVSDPQAECESYEKSINEAGGIDLQVLGIGQNGHIGFNEPADSLSAVTYLTSLTEDTIEANSRFFEKADDVPKQALTMGIGSIMKARKIILLASGSNKADAIAKLTSGKIDPTCPASVLQCHPDVTLICDEQSLGR